MIIVNGFQLLSSTTKRSILVAAVLDPPLLPASFSAKFLKKNISVAFYIIVARYWAICVLELFVNQVVK